MRSMYVSMPVFFLLLAASLSAYAAAPGQEPEVISPPETALAPVPSKLVSEVPPLPATPPASITVPEMPSATMELKWEDLAALLNRLLAEQMQRAHDGLAEEGPVEATVARAHYTVFKNDATRVTVEARFSVEVFKQKGKTLVPLLGETVAVTEVRLGDKPVPLVPMPEGGYGVVIDAPGQYEALVMFTIKCDVQNGEASLGFPCVKTPITTMDLYLQEAGTDFKSDQAVSIEIDKTEGGALIPASVLAAGTSPVPAAAHARLVFHPTETISVKWSIPAILAEEEQKRAQQLREQECRLAANVSTLAQISERYVLCYAKVEYDVLRGETDTITLRLPKGLNILDIKGTGMVWTVTDTEKEQQIEIKVNHKIEDRYDLLLRYEQALEPGAQTAVVPTVALDKTDRLVGYVGVSTRDAMELSLSPETSGVTRIDRSELPAGLQSLSNRPILFACKYMQPEHDIQIAIRKLQDISVRIAVIDHATFTSVLAKDGSYVTEAVFMVRNNEKQFLGVGLDKETKVWASTVNGQPVKPARDDSGGEVLIPLSKSSGGGTQDGVFPVSIIYETSAAKPFKELLDTRSLSLPKTDILVNQYDWTVYVPESRRFLYAKGDFEKSPGGGGGMGFGGYGGGLQKVFMGARPFTYSLADNQTATNLYAQTQEAMPAPPPASAAAPGEMVSSEPMASDGADREALDEDDAAAGVLPVMVNLPRAGIPVLFQRVLGNSEKELSLTLVTFPRYWVIIVSTVGALIAFLIGFALCRRLKRSDLSLWYRIFLAVLLLLACAGAGVLANSGTWREYVGIAGWALLAGCILGGLLPACHGKKRPPFAAGQEDAPDTATAS